MGTTCSFEMTVDFQRTTRRYIPEDRKFYTHTSLVCLIASEFKIPFTGTHTYSLFDFNRLLKKSILLTLWDKSVVEVKRNSHKSSLIFRTFLR
jgi:hypothetical protein